MRAQSPGQIASWRLRLGAPNFRRLPPMKTKLTRPLLSAFFIFAFVSAACAAPPYHFLREIHVGGDSGWDYLSLDPAAHRLYVTHGTKIVVIDTASDTVVGEIAGTPGVHGFALAPELNRGFASDGEAAAASVVDLQTLQTLARVPTGRGPDAILYDSGAQEVYAFNGRADTATAFSATTGKVLAEIPLPGRPEFAAADPAAGRVYDNIESKNEIVAIDTRTHAIVSTWPIAPGESASGLAIDPAHHRLFTGCHNKLMVMLDSVTGRVVATVPIGAGVDACAYDPGTRLAFSSCGDGTVTIAREETLDRLAVVQLLHTERGARTMALDPQTHRIYLATAQFEPQPKAAPGAPRRRPKMVPGTFKILVYGMN